MTTIYTGYPTQKEADGPHKKREVFSKENNYAEPEPTEGAAK